MEQSSGNGKVERKGERCKTIKPTKNTHTISWSCSRTLRVGKFNKPAMNLSIKYFMLVFSLQPQMKNQPATTSTKNNHPKNSGFPCLGLFSFVFVVVGGFASKGNAFELAG